MYCGTSSSYLLVSSQAGGWCTLFFLPTDSRQIYHPLYYNLSTNPPHVWNLTTIALFMKHLFHLFRKATGC
jgi:hypothetical protein